MRKLMIFLASVAIMVGVLYVANRTNPPQPQPQQKQAEVQPIPKDPIPAPKPKTLTLEQVLAGFSEQNIRTHINFLCSSDLAGRMSGQSGNRKAAAWAVERFKEYGLEPGFGTSYLQTFKIQNLNTSKEQGNGETSNIVGILRGTSDKCIVIGAHIDHIGYGPSMSRAQNRREIHPGADDNASSIGALMEIARAFSSLKGQNKHTIIFICFSAEEMGLLGADYYVSNPAIPLSQVDFMFNMDMIGRSKGGVDFMGAGQSPYREAAQKVSPKISTNKSAGGGSDHASFARKGIPAIFAHTGLHAEYHTPDDTPDRLNFTGIRDVAQWVFHFCWVLDSQQQFPRVNLFVPSGEWRDHDWEGR